MRIALRIFVALGALIGCVIALAGSLAGTALAEGEDKTPLVTPSLVAEETALRPGEALTVGVRLLLRPHWHVYWKNPGDSGTPPVVTWKLPPGYEAGPLEWPAPRRIETPPLVSYGFEGDVVLLARIRVPADAQVSAGVTLAARVEWLVCEETCIPGEADLALTLPVAKKGEGAAKGEGAKVVAAARERIPRPGEGFRSWIERQTADEIALRLDPPAGATLEGKSAYVYPDLEGLVEASRPQAVRTVPALAGGGAGGKAGEGLEITLARSGAVKGDQGAIRGVIALEGPGEALAIEFATGPKPGKGETGQGGGGGAPRAEVGSAGAGPGASSGPGGSSGAGTGGAKGKSEGLAFVALSAFLGGLLLNLMPCVFPVLAIKILSFVERAGEDPRKARAHGSVFALGVIASFLALGGLLLVLRAAGSQLGWGFQLQAPPVVAGLALLFFGIGLYFLGALELGEGVASAAGSVETSGGYAGSFFSGALAVAVATPCTAPFMGTALGYALLAPAREALLVFGSLGAGMAAPYVALSSFPALVRRLPRPGRWMVVLKEAMAFPMFATTLWLAWVLGLQAGSDRVVLLFGGFLGLGLAAWLRRAISPPEVEAGLGRRVASNGAAVLVAALALAVGVPWGAMGEAVADGGEPSSQAGAPAGPDQVSWKRWSREAVAAAVRERKIVYVDFTAAWCITCQVNKRVVFGSQDVRKRFQELGVMALKADWTNKDGEIASALEEHGRSGVPLNLVYGRAGEGPEVLPAMLTPAIVLEALERAAQGK